MPNPVSIVESRGENEYRSETFRTPAQTAGGAQVDQVCFQLGAAAAFDSGFTIDNINWAPDTLLTGVNTNTVTVNVRVKNAGVDQGVIATLAFVAGTNAPQFVPTTIPLTTVPTVRNAADVVVFEAVQAGTGLALPAGLLSMDIARNSAE